MGFGHSPQLESQRHTDPGQRTPVRTECVKEGHCDRAVWVESPLPTSPDAGSPGKVTVVQGLLGYRSPWGPWSLVFKELDWEGRLLTGRGPD